ncbi:MAG: tyrosine-type recombinase/integrase [Desulfobacterales bacterium]|jgi:integrase/recombinase XerD
MRVKTVIPDYLNHLKMLGRSYYTVKNARYTLRHFAGFLETENAAGIEELSADIVSEYQQELYFCLTAKGHPLTLRTQALRLSIVKGFTRFLKDRDYLIHDPGQALRLPKKPRRLPKVILSAAEIKKLLAAPDMRTNGGYRNRIILEILYDTAIRRAEVAGIKLHDLDLAAGYIRITGKGDKDRVVPLSRRVCELVQNYVLMARPRFVAGDDPGYLILNRWGQKMDPNGIWAVVKRCVALSGIKKNITTHTFRHTCATHMLKNGAPARHLQEMLGHESLESTQVYTHVTINDLKRVHAKYHPSEQL